MTAALLALLASATWGVADFAGGLASRRLHVAAVMAVVQIAGAASIALAVLVRGEPSLGALWPGAVAGALGSIAFPALYRALAVGTMGVIAPILATSAVIPVGAGIVAGERPGTLPALGGALAVIGVVLASRAPGAGGTRSTEGVPLALLATLLIGIELILLDRAADVDALWAVAALRTTACALTLPVVLALVLRGRVQLPGRPAALRLAAIGVADTAGNVAFAIATATGLLSVVAVLGALAPVVTVGLARSVLGERLSGAQAAGVGLALCGVGLVIAGG